MFDGGLERVISPGVVVVWPQMRAWAPLGVLSMLTT
jgi:hypothetical protein